MMSLVKTDSIIVRAPNWVGDAAMGTPFFASLRRTFPKATITCLCRPMVADIFRHNPNINHILELDESRGRSGWPAIRLNAVRLRRERFDLAFSLPNSLSAAMIFWLARIPQRFGYRGDWRRPLLTGSLPFPEKGKRPHRVECYLELLKLAVIAPIFDRKLSLTIPGEIAAAITGMMAERGVDPSLPYVAIAPGAAQPNKMWLPERFAELAQRLIDAGTPVVLVGGPAECELAGKIVKSSGRVDIANLVGTGSLLHTAEIIRRAAVFVGNDSGLAHVAAAVDTRSVILSGPGDQTEVAPYSDKAITIAKGIFCKPCYKNYCWRKDKPLECLELIGVDEVYDEIVRLVGQDPSAAKRSCPSILGKWPDR